MDFDPLVDFTNQATDEIAKHSIVFTLSPEKMMGVNDALANLTWSSIQFGEEEIDQVPADQRGIYAFVIATNNDSLPPHGYVMYVGIAGRNSQRSLRDRYKDYLNTKKVMKRARIARMIGTWHQVLRFYFAPIEDQYSTSDLLELERQVNTALMPPFSEGDLEADTKRKRRAFR